jgi:hypothetical protein
MFGRGEGWGALVDFWVALPDRVLWSIFYGRVAEWSGTGLQNLSRRFDSAHDLEMTLWWCFFMSNQLLEFRKGRIFIRPFWRARAYQGVTKDHILRHPAMPHWIRLSIFVGVLLFISALVGSAVVVPQLRLLHLLQAFIYVAIILLTGRNSTWGFGVAVFVSTAWNCLNLFVTHLFVAGAVLLWSFIHTGRLVRPETVMVFVGCLAHFLLIIACMVAFLRFRPGKKQWYQFFAGGLLVLVYMALAIIVAAPR